MCLCCLRAAAASRRVLVWHPYRPVRVGGAWACELRWRPLASTRYLLWRTLAGGNGDDFAVVAHARS